MRRFSSAGLGTSPALCLTKLRVASAKRVLVEELRTVTEISRLLDYGSEDGFSGAFRRHTGDSTSVWVAKAR